MWLLPEGCTKGQGRHSEAQDRVHASVQERHTKLGGRCSKAWHVEGMQGCVKEVQGRCGEAQVRGTNG